MVLEVEPRLLEELLQVMVLKVDIIKMVDMVLDMVQVVEVDIMVEVVEVLGSTQVVEVLHM
jgi:hypothetical protein